MLARDAINYQLEIYTADACWRGSLSYPDARRLTELLNDNGHGYIDLEHVDLIVWDGSLPQVIDSFSVISVSKKNTLAVVCCNMPAETPPNPTEYVRKVPRRVALYAPPIAIIGNFHAIPDAHLISAIDASRQSFIPITSAHIVRMDRQAPLTSNRSFALVNRAAITAVQSLAPEKDEKDVDSPSSLSDGSRVSRMLAVATKISYKD